LDSIELNVIVELITGDTPKLEKLVEIQIVMVNTHSLEMVLEKETRSLSQKLGKVLKQVLQVQEFHAIVLRDTQ